MATAIGSFDLASLKNLRDDVTQYFWFESNSSSAWGSGAHVTLYPESQFTDSTSPNYMKGQNIIMNTDGFSIRNGALPMMVLDNDSLDFNAVDTTQGTCTTMATFGLSGMQIYSRDSNNNLVQLANIGYGPGTDSDGGTSDAPYYTLGLRVGSIGNYSVSEGNNTASKGFGSHSEGWYTVADNNYSHAEGAFTFSGNNAAHAEGYSSGMTQSQTGVTSAGIMATGRGAHAEGEGFNNFEEQRLIASGRASHAEGSSTKAIGATSHAQNYHTYAAKDAQTALGTYNEKDTATTTTHPSGTASYGQYAVIVGNGTGDARSNALTVDWNGHVVATSAKKSIMYTGEFISVYGNQTASETAGQITLSGSYKNMLPANKYSTGLSPLGSELFSVSAGTVTLEKAGRYRVFGQIYIYNGFTVNDQVTACVTYNGTSSNLRSARTKVSNAAPYTTLSIDTYVNATAGAELQLVALNDTAARGKIGISSYTKMFIECLGVYE